MERKQFCMAEGFTYEKWGSNRRPERARGHIRGLNTI